MLKNKLCVLKIENVQWILRSCKRRKIYERMSVRSILERENFFFVIIWGMRKDLSFVVCLHMLGWINIISKEVAEGGINLEVYKRSMFSFEGTSLSDEAFSSCWLCQDIFAVIASNLRLSMTENHCDLATSTTLDIHEVGIGSRNQSLKFMLLFFMVEGWVKEISIH